jgi:murein DD-endopeptidase MepM/ murein hydrolase activator NlpD
MSNRFYTILIVPEKTSQVRRIVLPNWLFKSAAFGLAFVVLIAGVMMFHYWYVMSQIGENKQLKLENRRLRQQVQIFQNKISTVESTMDRVKSFATRLRVIMHVEEPSTLQLKLPDAGLDSEPHSSPAAQPSPLPSPADSEAMNSPENQMLQQEFASLESRMTSLGKDAFKTEEMLQNQYEILYDKKAFLSALPTSQPAPGLFTSGFGVRMSPLGNRIKMHEGLDIANRSGTVVRAPANGSVAFADSKAGYGTTVILNHGYGIETLYGHLKKVLVRPGDKVTRGMKIALLGNSGRSTGPHVHYEVRVKGYPVDPRSYIFEDSNP